MFLRKLLYGKNYVFLFILDSLLKCFQNSDYIDNKLFYDGSDKLPHFNQAIDKLVKEGLLEISSHGVGITLPGKMKVRTGGFLRESFLKRLARVGVTIGIIASLLAIVQYFSS
jgi:hypothetical protein